MAVGNPFADLIPKKEGDRMAPPAPPAATVTKAANPFMELVPKKAEPRPKKFSAGESALKSFTDMATSGFSDEIVGSVYSAVKKAGGDERPYSEIYNEATGRLRKHKEEAAEDHPVASTVGGVAGGLATAAVPGGAVVKGATLAAKAGRGAAAGAAYGAAYGAGSGEGLKGRIEEALKGAGTGFFVGGVAAPIAAGVGKGAGKVAEFTGIKKVAKDANLPATAVVKITEALKQDVQTKTLRRPSKGDMLMNMGPQLQSSAEAIATQPGKGQTVLREASYRQQSGEGSRIKEVVDRTLGKDQGRVFDKTGVESERKAAGKLYETAKASQTPVYTGPIRDKLDDLIASTDGGPRKALEGLRDLRVFKDIGPRVGRGDRSSAMDLHAARIAIDDAMDAAGKGTNAARLLGQVRNEIDDALKSSAPGYKQADADYSAALKARDALEDGRQVFTRAMSPDELAAELDGMHPTVRDRYLKGARDAISTLMGTARKDAAAVRRELFEKGWNREKLAVLVGAKRAGEISRVLEQATNRARGHEALTGNSRTAERLAAQKRFPGDTSAAEMSQKASQVSLSGAGLATLVHFANKLTGGKIAARVNKSRGEVREGAAKLLTAEGADIDRVVDILRRAQKAKGRALNAKEQYEALTNALALSSSQVAR